MQHRESFVPAGGPRQVHSRRALSTLQGVTLPPPEWRWPRRALGALGRSLGPALPRHTSLLSRPTTVVLRSPPRACRFSRSTHIQRGSRSVGASARCVARLARGVLETLWATSPCGAAHLPASTCVIRALPAQTRLVVEGMRSAFAWPMAEKADSKPERAFVR